MKFVRIGETHINLEHIITYSNQGNSVCLVFSNGHEMKIQIGDLIEAHDVVRALDEFLDIPTLRPGTESAKRW